MSQIFMDLSSDKPTEQIASSIVKLMTGEQTSSALRMATGDQNYVFEVKTSESEYVIRLTDEGHKQKFISAMYWQSKLIPLGVPLAEFIQTDLEGKYSKFPALLMKRLPGNDLINVYGGLKDSEKRSLAEEIVKIQAMATYLPEGASYGITDSYEHPTGFNTWFEFLMQRLHFYEAQVAANHVFEPAKVSKVISIANKMKDELKSIRATPFLWDASERNVMVQHGKITGIVDVDELCFGDPLFVIALTSAALELEGHDTIYTDHWATFMDLDQKAKQRLAFYRLFYAVAFMRKHANQTTNNKKVIFDVERLNRMYLQACNRIA